MRTLVVSTLCVVAIQLASQNPAFAGRSTTPEMHVLGSFANAHGPSPRRSMNEAMWSEAAVILTTPAATQPSSGLAPMASNSLRMMRT